MPSSKYCRRFHRLRTMIPVAKMMTSVPSTIRHLADVVVVIRIGHYRKVVSIDSDVHRSMAHHALTICSVSTASQGESTVILGNTCMSAISSHLQGLSIAEVREPGAGTTDLHIEVRDGDRGTNLIICPPRSEDGEGVMNGIFRKREPCGDAGHVLLAMPI